MMKGKRKCERDRNILQNVKSFYKLQDKNSTRPVHLKKMKTSPNEISIKKITESEYPVFGSCIMSLPKINSTFKSQVNELVFSITTIFKDDFSIFTEITTYLHF